MNRSQTMNDGSPKGNDILVNAAVQATLISLKDEIEAGATLGDVYEIVTGLLYFAQGNRIH